MKNFLLIFIFITLIGCGTSISSPQVVNMPAEYGPEEAQALLAKINFEELKHEVVRRFPTAVENEVAFYYKPLVFKSSTGKPDRIVVKIEVQAPDGWKHAKELENFLAQKLRDHLPGT